MCAAKQPNHSNTFGLTGAVGCTVGTEVGGEVIGRGVGGNVG